MTSLPKVCVTDATISTWHELPFHGCCSRLHPQHPRFMNSSLSMAILHIRNLLFPHPTCQACISKDSLRASLSGQACGEGRVNFNPVLQLWSLQILLWSIWCLCCNLISWLETVLRNQIWLNTWCANQTDEDEASRWAWCEGSLGSEFLKLYGENFPLMPNSSLSLVSNYAISSTERRMHFIHKFSSFVIELQLLDKRADCFSIPLHFYICFLLPFGSLQLKL